MNPNMSFRGQKHPIPYNINNYNYYGYQPRRGGYYKNYRGNRNNNYYYNKNRRYQNKNIRAEETGKENNNNKIDLTEYNKLQTEEEKKDYLGEKIFNAIEKSQYTIDHNINFETIGKITGMIIELPDQKEIIEILEKPNILNNRIEEALNLINKNA